MNVSSHDLKVGLFSTKNSCAILDGLRARSNPLASRLDRRRAPWLTPVGLSPPPPPPLVVFVYPLLVVGHTVAHWAVLNKNVHFWKDAKDLNETNLIQDNLLIY